MQGKCFQKKKDHAGRTFPTLPITFQIVGPLDLIIGKTLHEIECSKMSWVWVVGRGRGSWVWVWVNIVGKQSIEKMIK